MFKKQVTAWAEVKGELAGRLGESGRNEQSGRGPAKGKRKGSAHTAVTPEALWADLCPAWGTPDETQTQRQWVTSPGHTARDGGAGLGTQELPQAVSNLADAQTPMPVGGDEVRARGWTGLPGKCCVNRVAVARAV